MLKPTMQDIDLNQNSDANAPLALAEALRRSEARLRAIFNGATIAILLLELNGRVLQSNRAFTDIFGFSESDIQDQSISRCIYPDAWLTFQQQLTATQQNGRSQGVVRCQTADGEAIWGNVSAALLRDQNKRPYRLVLMIEDISTQQEVELELKEVKRRLARSRQKEQQRLAQELHDGPIQDLYAARFQLQTLIRNNTDPQNQALLHNIDDLFQKVNTTLRTVCGELRPPALAPFGLEAALRSHVEKFQELYPHLNVRLTLMQDDQTLSEHMRLALFRIAQEGLNNVAKHANAQNVQIRFELDEEKILLEIEDDGVGFEVPQRWFALVQNEHLGLVGASERAEEINGRLTILSTPGQGTILRVIAPQPGAIDA